MSRTKHGLLVFAACALAACTFTPNVPSGNVICHKPADCPSDYICEPVAKVNGVVSVCCKNRGCTTTLTPDQIAPIEAIAQRDGGGNSTDGSDAPYARDGLWELDSASDEASRRDGPFYQTASLDG